MVVKIPKIFATTLAITPQKLRRFFEINRDQIPRETDDG
jgi:hypothetical protein